MRKTLTAIAAVASLAAVTATATVASATPARPMVTGYHSIGTKISPNGHPGQCLSAGKAEAGSQLYIFTCVPGDKLQIWTALSISGTVIISLTYDPELVIGGIPAVGNEAELIFVAKNADVPLPQSTFIKGRLIQPPVLNNIKNSSSEYLSLPQFGREIFWAKRGLLTLNWTRNWVFTKGWTAESSV